MPTQEYHCKADGSFDVRLTFAEDVPVELSCPDCGALSQHVLRPPAGIKVVRTWNEQANEQQRDPYTMAKAQATNMYHEQKDMGIRVEQPTEAGLQAAAAEIAKEKIPKAPKHNHR